MLVPRRRTAEVDHGIEVVSARDLVKVAWDSVDVDAVCPGVRIQPRALLLIAGPPGAGKSTLALSLANTSSGPVVLFSAEERLGAAVGERLSRLGIHRGDFHIVGRATVDELVGLCRKTRASVLVIDSVQATTLLPDDLRTIINNLGLQMLIGTSQMTKDGSLRGSLELLHEADLVINIEDEQWSVTKSRFSPTGVSGRVQYGSSD